MNNAMKNISEMYQWQDTLYENIVKNSMEMCDGIEIQSI